MIERLSQSQEPCFLSVICPREIRQKFHFLLLRKTLDPKKLPLPKTDQNIFDCSRRWPKLVPKSSAIQIDFAAKSYDCFLGLIARWWAGLISWTQTWTVQPDQGVAVVKVLSNQKSQNNLCGVEFFLLARCQSWGKLSDNLEAYPPVGWKAFKLEAYFKFWT